MYKVGDFVFFETSANAPYQIRRIEELSKNANGSVEAKVTCYYRRRDISSTLVQLADKHQDYLDELEEENEEDARNASVTHKYSVSHESSDQNGNKEKSSTFKSKSLFTSCNSGANFNDISSEEKRELNLREIFLSRHQEVLPATHIRGKCIVRLANPVAEPIKSYLTQENLFFYRLVYDHNQKSLLADRGDIRIGTKWQAQIPQYIDYEGEDERDLVNSRFVWNPSNDLNDYQIDQFLELSRAVGTFARAQVSGSSVCEQSTIAFSASSASRDITTERALTILHNCGYDICKAMTELVKDCKPLLCMDELESWTASESHIFAEALNKYGKELSDIRTDFLPWKTMPQIVEYFRFWKTTGRYVSHRRAKVKEAESQLKQIYIPNYMIPNPAVLYHNRQQQSRNSNNDKAVCESCLVATSPQWYAWGPPNLLCRLCSNCWMFWKRYGGLKNLKHIAGEKSQNPSSNLSNLVKNGHTDEEVNNISCSKFDCDKELRFRHQHIRHLVQARNIHLEANGRMTALRPRSYYLQTSNFMRLARRLISKMIKLKSLPKFPFTRVNMTHEQIVKYAQLNIPKMKPDTTNEILHFKLKFSSLEALVQKLRSKQNITSNSNEMPKFLNGEMPAKLTSSSTLAFPVVAHEETSKLSSNCFRDCLEKMSVPVESSLVTSISNRSLLNSKSSFIRKRDWRASNNNQLKHSFISNSQSELKTKRFDGDALNGETGAENHILSSNSFSSQISRSSEESV